MGARVVVSFEGAIVSETELEKAVTVVGRHPACDIWIDHPAVSGRHMLFRLVNRTVYVEDLASTNGTKVNGIATGHQVVHHLDLIEVGKHKLHFFDDSLLAGAVGDLEKTVHTDFERTMLVSHVASPAPASAAPAASASASARQGDDLSRTMAIPRDPALRAGAVHETVRTRGSAHAKAVLALKVVAGERKGEVIALDQTNTMLGSTGADTALIVKRGEGFFLARFGGGNPPRLNGRDLPPGAHPVAPRDVVDVGASRYEVIEESR
ncbi:MAG TPA: FHA domain-containing protein [Usitatibacter sp.]